MPRRRTSPSTSEPERTMTIIRQADLVETVAAALQYISYYHPADFISHLARAYEREQGPAAKDAIAQILTNSKMCAEGRRPICQDTGIVNVFLRIGMDVRFEGFIACTRCSTWLAGKLTSVQSLSIMLATSPTNLIKLLIQ